MINTGTALSVRYYNRSIAGSYYDDNAALTLSGTTWTSGIFATLDNKGADALLVAQGRLVEDDAKIYLPGEVPTSGMIKFGIGSPGTRFYSAVNIGPLDSLYNQTSVFNTCYVRFLTNGSLAGESIT